MLTTNKRARWLKLFFIELVHDLIKLFSVFSETCIKSWRVLTTPAFLFCFLSIAPPPFPSLLFSVLVAMESSSVASASSEAGSTRSQEIEELERFIDSYVLEYQVQGLLNDKNENENEIENADKTQSNISQVYGTII